MTDEKSKQLASSIVLAQHGNKNAYREIYRAYYKKIFFICSAMTGDSARAIDLTTEIFIKMFDALEKLGDYKDFENWFFALTINLGRGSMTDSDDALINEKIPTLAKTASESAVARDKFAFEHTVVKILTEMVLTMPAEARIILFYKYFTDMDNEKIALIEKTTAEEIEKQAKAVTLLLDRQTEKILEYGVDISMFTKDMENSLLYISSKVFVPAEVHTAVSQAVGIDVDPFAAPKKEKADDSVKEHDASADKKARKKRFFTKNDLILFLVVVAVSLIIFSAVKLYGKFGENNRNNGSTLATKQESNVIVWNGAAAPSFASGSGTKEDPFIIENGGQLAYLANIVNDGNSLYTAAYYRMTKDIYLNKTMHDSDRSNSDLSNNWMPIGTAESPFCGVFDGTNHTIYGLYVGKNEDNSGLFGVVKNGSINNITLRNAYVTGKDNVGGLIGTFISDTDKRIGVSLCGVYGTVSASGKNAGGMIGCVTNDNGAGVSVVEYCCLSGIVTAENGMVGGLIGFGYANSGTIKISDCFNAAKIAAKTGYAGGLAGNLTAAEGNILTENCYNTEKINAVENAAGGAVGLINAEGSGRINISRCIMSDSAAPIDVIRGNGGDKLVVSDVKKCSKEDMAKAESFNGFDFSEIWKIDSEAAYRFPVLIGLKFVSATPEEFSF